MYFLTSTRLAIVVSSLAMSVAFFSAIEKKPEPLQPHQNKEAKKPTSNFVQEELPGENIKVRESTTELHIQVGEKLFVFGKSRGTLDKVKIGMHVLSFAQLAGTEGLESGFKTVSWKKLRDGSIQIQSSYAPWPSVLTWTVLASGQLKMEALGNLDSHSANSIGLGFDLPNHELSKMQWSTKDQAVGVWQPENLQESSKVNPIYLHGIEEVNLNFESVSLAIKSDTPDLVLKFPIPLTSGSTANPSDLSFLFSGIELSTPGSLLPDSPSDLKTTTPNQVLSTKAMVLWFDFH
jgi:hypothetical protein